MPSGQFRLRGPEGSAQQGESAYWLRYGKKEVPLEQGETYLGRGEGCRILITDGLVSRQHARIVVEGVHLSLEDLGSANGTFLNQVRILGRTPLIPGDRIVIGTCEIELLELADVGAPAESAEEDRETPSSGIGVLARITLSKVSAEVTGVDTDRGDRLPTDRMEEFEFVGRMADRMLAMGRAQAAERLLAEPILGVLAEAREGVLPNAVVVDAVGRYGVKLAQEVLDGRWVDAAIEVHLLVGRPLRATTLQQLAILRARTHAGDDALIARYYETLRALAEFMEPGEQILCDLIGDLVPGLEGEETS